MIRLKARPARLRNQGIAFLANWLEQCSIDPGEICRGTTAVQALFGRLITQHGNTSMTLDGATLSVGPTTKLTPDNVRSYIWGESTEVITVDDAEIEKALEEERATEPMMECSDEIEED